MSRPKTIRDLPNNLLARVEVATINLNEVYAHGGSEALNAATSFLESAAAARLFVDRSKGKVERALTDAEKFVKLADAQKYWDSYKNLYDQAIENPLIAPEWQRGLIDKWAKDQGLEPINWEVAA